MRPPRFRGWWLFIACAVLMVSVIYAQQAKKVDDNAIKNAGKTVAKTVQGLLDLEVEVKVEYPSATLKLASDAQKIWAALPKDGGPSGTINNVHHNACVTKH